MTQHAAFRTPFPPSDDTYAGSLMLRVAAGHDREDLEEYVDEIGAEFDEFFDEPKPDDPHTVLKEVIAAYKKVVTEVSADAEKLDEALSNLEDRGIAVSYAEAFDAGDAAQQGHENANELEGSMGYCYVHAQDVDRMIMTGRLYFGYSSQDAEAESTKEVGQLVADVLRAHGLPVVWSGDINERIVVEPVVIELPFED